MDEGDEDEDSLNMTAALDRALRSVRTYADDAMQNIATVQADREYQDRFNFEVAAL